MFKPDTLTPGTMVKQYYIPTIYNAIWYVCLQIKYPKPTSYRISLPLDGNLT